MKNRRKFSIFISSTYEDLKKERQALVGVALENNFIPVGMEQFHAAPTSQWNVITKMIDECDFYLLNCCSWYSCVCYKSGAQTQWERGTGISVKPCRPDSCIFLACTLLICTF